jgi:tRNA(fMet)-specific endonuclease VapC
VTVLYVLDTNAVTAVMKHEQAIFRRLRAIHPSEVGVPQPVLAEVAFGVERLPRSKRRELLAGQLQRLRSVFQRLTWTDDVSDRFGEIKAHLQRVGSPIEDFDVAIAAHALSVDAVLVSSNVRHMTRVPGLRVEDWSER